MSAWTDNGFPDKVQLSAYYPALMTLQQAINERTATMNFQDYRLWTRGRAVSNIETKLLGAAQLFIDPGIPLDGMGGDDISAFKFQSLAQLAASIGESLIDPAQAENKLLAWVMQRYRMINALKWSVNRPDGSIAGTSVSGDEEALTAMGAVNAAIANATTRDKSILPSATRQTYRVEQRSDLSRYSNGEYNFHFSSSKFTWTDSLPNKIYTHVEAANSAIITGKYRAGWNLETSSEIGYSSPSELASCDPDIGQTVRGYVYITAYMIRNISSDFEYYDAEEEP